MSNSSGQLVGEVTRYTPFGAYRSGGPNAITDRGFTGQKENAYIKLIDMRARWYDPAIGRFISPDTIVPDPANPQSLNRYSYTNNNPVNYVDPSGHYAANVNGAIDDCYDLYQCQNSYTPSSEDAVYPEEFESAGEYILPPDHKIGVGVEISGHIKTPPVSANGNIGREWVYDPIKKETTEFLVIGGGIQVHPFDPIAWFKNALMDEKKPRVFSTGLSVSPYVAGIYNVNDVVNDYSGPFLYGTNTLAYKYGITWGEAWSLNDPEREFAYSNVWGLAFGYDVSKNIGASYYIPIKTNDSTLLPTYHVDKWLEILTGG